jgi:hypothetical protein
MLPAYAGASADVDGGSTPNLGASVNHQAFRGGRRLTAALDDFNRKFDGDRSSNRVVHRRMLISPANEISEGRLVGICGSETDYRAHHQWSRRNIGTDSQQPSVVGFAVDFDFQTGQHYSGLGRTHSNE